MRNKRSSTQALSQVRVLGKRPVSTHVTENSQRAQDGTPVTGSTGATGATGATGPMGFAGAPGAQGPPGDPGEDGIPGSQGARGDTGATGAIGPMGLMGVPGAIGETGDRGEDGFPGPIGPTGSQGATGLTGPVGPMGPMGPPGVDGEPGPEGPPGPPGPVAPVSAGSLSGATLAPNVVNSSLTSVGALTGGSTGLGFTINFGLSNTLGDLPLTNLTQGLARSVLGVTGNATADHASIQGAADQVLRVNAAGNALAFGAIDLTKAAAAVLAFGTPGYNAADYTGSGAMSVTVESADVVTNFFAQINELMIWSFVIFGISIGGTPDAEIRLTIPNGRSSAKRCAFPITVVDAGAAATFAYGEVQAATNYLRVFRNASATGNWGASLHMTQVQGTVVFAVTP